MSEVFFVRASPWERYVHRVQTVGVADFTLDELRDMKRLAMRNIAVAQANEPRLARFICLSYTAVDLVDSVEAMAAHNPRWRDALRSRS